jgi:hypothetical protein
MAHHVVNDFPARLPMWQRVREYAVPPSMIEISAARRAVGDWAGACAAARISADLDLRVLRHRYGAEFVTRLRADLRRLALDLLLRAEGRPRGAFTVRLGACSRTVLELVAPDDSHAPGLRPLRDALPSQYLAALPVLPEAAARSLPDLWSCCGPD